MEQKENINFAENRNLGQRNDAELDNRAFEDALRTDRSDDPLDLWLCYIDWREKQVTYAGTSSMASVDLISLYEKCAREYRDHPQYRNDVRYIRVWAKFADRCQKPLDVYAYMNDSRIGWLVAVFYERWSAAYLLARDPRNAQRVLDLGISRKARPLRRLTEALYAARYSGHPPETTSNGSQTHLTALLLQKNGFVEEISPEELRAMQSQYRYPNDRVPKHSSKHTPGTRTDHTSTHNNREPSASSGYHHSTPLVDEYVNGYARGIGGMSPLPDATPSYVNTHVGFSPTPNSETRPQTYPDTHTHTYIYAHTHHPDVRTNRRGEPHLQHTDVYAHRHTPAHTHERRSEHMHTQAHAHTHTHTQPRDSRSEPVSVQGEGHNTVHGDEDTQTNNNKNDKAYDTTHADKHTHTQATNNNETGDIAHVEKHAHTQTNKQTYGTTQADKYTHTPHVGVREARACVSVRRDISDDPTHSTTHALRTAGDGTDVKGNKGKVSPGQIKTGAQDSRRSYMVVDGERGVYIDSPAKGSARGDGGGGGRYSDIQAQGSEYGDGDMDRDGGGDRDRDRGEYRDVETRTDELGRERRPFGVEAAVSEVRDEDRRGSDRTSAAVDARHRDRRMQADGMQRSDNMRHRENLRQSADTSRSVVAGVRRLSLVAGDSREESGDELTGCGNSAGAERIVGLAEPLERDEGIRIPKYIGTGIGRADRLRDGAPVNARTPAYMSHVRHDIGGPIPYVSDVREPGHTPSATGSRRSSMMNSGQIRRSDSRSGDIRTGDRPFTGDAIGQGKTPGCTGSRRSSLVSSGQLRRNGTTLKPEPELLSNRREGTGSTELANGLSTHDPFEEKNVRACLECVQMPNHCVFRCLEESAPPISDNRKSLRKSVVLADGMAYVVVKCIGVGAWAKVYLAEHTDPPQHHSTQLYAMKVTRRAIGQWESYIAHELQRRFKLLPPHLSTTTNYRVFGQAHNLHVYADAAIVMVDYLDGGSLLDAVNAYDSAGVSMPLELVMFYAVEIMRIVEVLHACDILHGDLKPDNFLLRNGPGIPDSDWSPDKNPDWEEFGLQLIDFGRSVDCALYPAQTQFSGSNKTEGFICMEMAAHRPWRYQVDTFGVLGIIHCLFHKRYMSVEKRGSRWKPKEAFKRYWQADLWAELFDTFLNINPADEAPSLAPYRIRIERELRDPKRVCKLNAQLKEQISLVQRYRASTGGKVRR